MKPNLKCLLDTNILIQLEEPDADGSFKEGFSELARLCHKFGVALFYHPLSEQDLRNDPNDDRRRKSLEWLKKYAVLEGVPIAERTDLESKFLAIKSGNDFIDCQLLHALSLNCVDYLISQDGALRARAAYSGIGNRTYSIKEFNSFLQRLYEPTQVFIPNVEEVKTYALDRNDPIFKSLRDTTAYNFDAWLDKCNKDHRDAWIVRDGKRLAALCIIKLENPEQESIPELKEKTLKLCTFKVADDFRGGKIGELLLKKAFNYALANQIPSVYVTFFANQEYLSIFLKDFGFQTSSVMTKLGEFIYYKTFVKPPADEPKIQPVDFHKKYSPYYYCGDEIHKYIVPIIPEYHSALFPELAEQLSLPLTSQGRIPGNTIKKVYICNSNTGSLAAGSLILFYASKIKRAITTLGVVEQSLRTSNLSEALRMLGKRSVYTLDEIEKIVSAEALIVDFRLANHFDVPITFEELKKLGVLKGPPISIVKLKQPTFAKMQRLLEPNFGV